MSPKWMHLVGLTDICVVKELSVVWSGSEAVAAIGDRHFGRSRGRCLLAFQSLAGRRSNRCMLQSVRRKASWTCLFSFRHVREQFRGARKSLVFARARADSVTCDPPTMYLLFDFSSSVSTKAAVSCTAMVGSTMWTLCEALCARPDDVPL